MYNIGKVGGAGGRRDMDPDAVPTCKYAAAMHCTVLYATALYRLEVAVGGWRFYSPVNLRVTGSAPVRKKGSNPCRVPLVPLWNYIVKHISFSISIHDL